MLTTRPIAHNVVAVLCDGYIVFTGTAAQCRELIGV